MKPHEVLDWMEFHMSEFAERSVGDEVYEFFAARLGELLATNRSAVVRALGSWLALRSEPRTMLALRLAVAHHLVELKRDIEDLLDEVKRGQAFRPYYADIIGKFLSKL